MLHIVDANTEGLMPDEEGAKDPLKFAHEYRAWQHPDRQPDITSGISSRTLPIRVRWPPLSRFYRAAPQGRRVAVLGEMAELGTRARYHRELAANITSGGIDRIYLLGNLYDDLWSDLPLPMRGIDFIKAGHPRALTLRKQVIGYSL